MQNSQAHQAQQSNRQGRGQQQPTKGVGMPKGFYADAVGLKIRINSDRQDALAAAGILYQPIRTKDRQKELTDKNATDARSHRSRFGKFKHSLDGFRFNRRDAAGNVQADSGHTPKGWHPKLGRQHLSLAPIFQQIHVNGLQLVSVEMMLKETSKSVRNVDTGLDEIKVEIMASLCFWFRAPKKRANGTDVTIEPFNFPGNSWQLCHSVLNGVYGHVHVYWNHDHTMTINAAHIEDDYPKELLMLHGDWNIECVAADKALA